MCGSYANKCFGVCCVPWRATAKATQTLNVLTTAKTRELKTENIIGNYEADRRENRKEGRKAVPSDQRDLCAHELR